MTIYNDELYHWGIKGMKWGVRRYQKANGTLTDEGRKRYGRSEEGADEKKPPEKLRKHAKSKTNHMVIEAYKTERRRQRKYLSTKHAVLAGQSMVNSYLRSRNVTLNGKPLHVNSAAVAAVNAVLDLKYMKDTLK